MAARYSHADLLTIVRDSAAAVLRCRPGELAGLDAERPLALACGFARREVMQLAELLEEALGLAFTPADLARLLYPRASFGSAVRLCAECLLRQDCAWPPPPPEPVAILGVRRHA